MEENNVNGNFAVKIGNMWGKKEYGEGIKLTSKPDTILDFKSAYEISKKTGGEIYMFKPQKIDDSEIKTYTKAAGLEKEEE